jgi:hypothetical protein
MMALKIISYIVTCLLGIWAIVADVRDKGQKRMGTPSVIRVSGLVVSLLFSVILAFSDTNKPSAIAPETLPDPVLQRPIDSLAFRYGVTYSVDNVLLKPLAKRLDRYIASHPESLIEPDDDDGKTQSDPKRYNVPYELIKDTPLWHLARGQNVIVNFYPRGTTLSSVRRTDYQWEEDAGESGVDKTPLGGIQVKFPLFDYAHPEQYGFAYEPGLQLVRLIRITSTEVLHDYWRTEKFTTFGDFLGSLMLVRIKVDGMETMMPIVKLLALGGAAPKGNDLTGVGAAEDFFDGTGIVFVAIQTDRRWYGFLTKDFQAVASHGSGSRLFTTWPAAESALPEYQANFPTQ